MRLDKYLKVSRIIKRRTVAKEISDKERILINGKLAKSSTKVKIGDILTLEFGTRTLVVKVEAIVDSTKKEDAATMYSIVSDTPKERENSLLF